MSSKSAFSFTSDSSSVEPEIVSYEGRCIDVTGAEWRLGPEVMINWATLPPLGSMQITR